LHQWKQDWTFHNITQFSDLIAWWRHNCKTLHVMRVYVVRTEAIKCSTLFDYNCGNSWQLLIIFVQLETRMNTLPNRLKQCHFNLTKSPLYFVKLKIAQNGRLLTAVCSVKSIAPHFRRKSFSVSFVYFLFVRNFLAVFWQKYFTYARVVSKIYPQTQYG